MGAMLLASCAAPQSSANPFAAAVSRHAQPDINYKQLYSFRGAPDGSEPLGTLLYADGEFYGTTLVGGYGESKCNSCGTVFRISRTGEEAVIARFAGPPGGKWPQAGLALLDGKFYGTTSAGGDSCTGSCGTVYSASRSGDIRIVHSFTGGQEDGSDPRGGLVSVNGTLYGTTWSGGSGNGGTVFSITGSRERVLQSFSGGAHPIGTLVSFKGSLYGVTQMGGSNNDGTVFVLPPSGDLRLLHSFVNATDGRYPVGLVAYRGRLYGAASEGGPFKRGTIFSLSTDGAFAVVHSFRGYVKGDGALPEAPPIIVKGTLYGTTQGGGTSGDGTIYKLDASGNELVEYSFGKNPDGVHPESALTYVDGVLYGTTYRGGHGGSNGTVFRIVPL